MTIFTSSTGRALQEEVGQIVTVWGAALKRDGSLACESEKAKRTPQGYSVQPDGDGYEYPFTSVAFGFHVRLGLNQARTEKQALEDLLDRLGIERHKANTMLERCAVGIEATKAALENERQIRDDK